MKRIVSATAVFLCGISLLQAQPVRVSETLKELDMENISVVEKRDTITAAFETSAYRGIYNGIGIAIRHLVAIPEIPTLQLLILDNALPQRKTAVALKSFSSSFNALMYIHTADRRKHM